MRTPTFSVEFRKAAFGQLGELVLQCVSIGSQRVRRIANRERSAFFQ